MDAEFFPTSLNRRTLSPSTNDTVVTGIRSPNSGELIESGDRREAESRDRGRMGLGNEWIGRDEGRCHGDEPTSDDSGHGHSELVKAGE